MSETSFADAREQACAAIGFMRSKVITTSTRTWEIPNPSLLSPDQSKRMRALDLWVQTTAELDRFKDTKDSNGNTMKGAPKIPWRTPAGELVDDDYDVRLTKAIFGPDLYDEFVQDGGYPSDIELHWTAFRKYVEDRKAADSKSGTGGQPVAPVPDAN